MRKVVYDVTMSLDGYIAGPDGSVDAFSIKGSHMDDYQKRLLSYDTVLMGKKTYEIGYKFGLKPGEVLYPHMKHYIFSHSIDFEESGQVFIVRNYAQETVRELRGKEGGDIFLAGGGIFAGSLLRLGFIDVLKINVNPVVLGGGVKLFDNPPTKPKFHLVSGKKYRNGVALMTYSVKY